jgi:hypothetical protein
VDAVMGLWLATFLAGCASKVVGASNSVKCYPSIPIPELSLPLNSFPIAINRSHFFGPS